MKVGLLPLYIKYYDDLTLKYRERMGAFYDELASMIEKNGIEVVKSEICRLAPEFKSAVNDFEKAEVDAIVTIHLAYSPSLESIEALSETKLPIIVLDTTDTFDFSQMQSPAQIMYCHGIHGVMDMCSMLKRKGKAYAIAAGHYLESDVVERVCGFVKAAVSAKALSDVKVGVVGGVFDGMGDFDVEAEELKERFGIDKNDISAQMVNQYINTVSDKEIDDEIAYQKENYVFTDDVDFIKYRSYVKTCLGFRKLLETEGYGAFSVNFRNIEEIPFMPFVECCEAMKRGIGYAGEGDSLTSSFTASFLKAYPKTGFVEVFCPDWKGNTLFMSHMGEMNYNTADSKPEVYCLGNGEKYVGYARMEKGKGVYVNISRDKDDYQLLLSPCEMVASGPDNFPKSMRGWMKHDNLDVAKFLEELSINGATHHSCFVYGATVEELAFYGKLLNLKTVIV